MSSAARARHWLRGRRLTALGGFVVITAIAAVVSVLACDRFMVLTSANRFVEDWEVSHWAPIRASDPDIDIVAIREDTLSRFPYRSPIDRAFLANLVQKIAAAKPKAIGIDIVFDQKTEPAKDALLKNVLMHSQVPLVVAYTEEPTIVTDEQIRNQREFVPAPIRAMINLKKDQYGTVRWIFPGAKDEAGHFVTGFEPALAQLAGAHATEPGQPIVWTRPPPDPSLTWFQRLKTVSVSSQDQSSFLEIWAHIADRFPPQTYAGKIVLIGSDFTLEDRHRTPFAASSNFGLFAGVVVHAYAIATLIHHELSPYTGFPLKMIIATILAALGSIFGMLNLPLLTRVAALAGIVILFWIAGVTVYAEGNVLVDLLAPSLALVASFSGMDSLTGRAARRQRQFVQTAFSRYVSPKIVDRLIEDPSRMSLEGERREMTFLFTDVANFTTMSETMDSRALGPLLNSYFEGVTAVILQHDGTLDKFIGDGVFAIFNAPVDQAGHEAIAVRCALEIDRFCEEFRARQIAAGVPFGVTRIGLNTGAAVVGNFGSPARFNYTAQGDAVNTASRLEGLNKYVGTRVCVSGATHDACRNLAFRQLGTVRLKGKTQFVPVWEPLHPGALSQDQIDRYEAAFARLGDSPERALALFETLADERPEDPAILFHLHRLRAGISGSEIAPSDK